MIRERIGHAALRAYPAAVRQTRGPEMVGMALDAGEQSNLAFVRESASLVLGGLRERRAIIKRAGARRLIADACCQAVVVSLILGLIGVRNEAIVGFGQQVIIPELVLTGLLICALVGYERIVAVSGLVLLVGYGPAALDAPLASVAAALVPVACLLIMACAPRKRTRAVRRLLWLLPLGAVAVLEPQLTVGVPELLALVSLVGLVRVFYDPRLAIACSLIWAFLLAHHAARLGHVGPGRPMILVLLTAGVSLVALSQAVLRGLAKDRSLE